MNKKKIYVASSWRNEHQQMLVDELRKMGHEVYDFKHPNGDEGFQWSNIDENWQDWTMEQYRENLKSEHAQFGLNRDFDAMKAADVCILCLPCGRSAHLEAGWMKGAGKKVIAYIHPGEKIEPELMYGIIDGIALNMEDVADMVNKTYSFEPDNKPTAVDLGLPSGTKWADRNVGANSPEETGLFFSWGNVDGVENGKACDFREEAYAETEGAKLKGNLDAAHDAATVNLGAPWRMPTDEEFKELYDNCDWEWTSENGYHGVRFTSKINGKSIFFAASGYGAGSSWNSRGAIGSYWSASFNSSRYARGLNFYSGGVNPQDYDNRYYGFAVRAVQN